MQGAVYLAILNNAEEWYNYSSASSNPLSDGMFFDAGGRRYAVQFEHTYTQRVLFIQTLGSGWPATELGRGGYFYTANGELSFEDSRYEIERLSNNIFCYKKKGLPRI